MMSIILFTTTLNNMTNSRSCIVFSLGASKVDQKLIFISAKWLNFANFRGSWSEVAHNVVFDNFYFDQNIVRLKVKSKKNCHQIIKFVSLDNFEELNNTKYEVYHRDISCLRHNL